MSGVLRFFRVDDDHPLTGWHALALVGAFFAVIVSVNIVMALYATRTFPGLVVKNSYVASQNYNETLAAARAQAASGLAGEIGQEGGIVAFRIAGPDGAAIHSLTVRAHVGRPANTRQDIELELIEAGDGYRAPGPLAPGRWEVDIEARRAGELVYRDRRTIFVPRGLLE